MAIPYDFGPGERLLTLQRMHNRRVSRRNAPGKAVEYAVNLVDPRTGKKKWVYISASLALLLAVSSIRNYSGKDKLEARIVEVDPNLRPSKKPVYEKPETIDAVVEPEEVKEVEPTDSVKQTKPETKPKRPAVELSDTVKKTAEYILTKNKEYKEERGLEQTLKQQRAEHYAKCIDETVRRYKLPFYEFLGILTNEHYFVNATGDINNYVHVDGKRIYNPSESLCQIGKETQKTILNLMKTKGEKNIPDEVPKNLNKHPRLAIRMSGFYFRYLIDLSGNIEKAIGCYNGGPGYSNPAYKQKVLRIKRDAELFFGERKPKEITMQDVMDNARAVVKHMKEVA